MAAEKSMGTKLYHVDGGTETPIADLSRIGEVGGESDEIDTTTLDSPDGYKEFIPGLKDGGEVAFEGTLKSEANLEDLVDFYEGQTVESWKVLFPLGSTWEFSAFVKTVKEGESTPEGKRTFNGVLRVSGKPTYTPTIPSG